MSSAALVLGLDVGATRVRAAAARGFEILVTRSATWPAGLTPEAEADFVADTALRALHEAAPGAYACAAGVALAALTDDDGRVVAWPNRPNWAGLPLRARLEARLGLTVRVEDDANAAALGEWRLGNGRGYTSGLVMTVGTGVGAGLVLDGQLWRGRHGWAGELGHVIVQPGGPECACGRRGCVQALASGRGLDRLAREHGLGGGEDLAAAAERGETWAHEALVECGRWLGLGAANAVTLLDLEVVIVGGALGRLGAPFWPALEASLHANLPQPEARGVALLRALLGAGAGLVGALGLALELAARAVPQEVAS